jgi:membrane protease YdiL (CAAX protease family)
LMALPATLGAFFKLVHPDAQIIQREFSEWFFASHALNSFLLTGFLYFFIRRGGEKLKDFTRAFEVGDIAWGIALSILGLVASGCVWSILSRFPLWFGGSTSPLNIEFMTARLGPFYIAAMLINPFCEEGFMRGYLQTRLRQNRWWSVNVIFLSVLAQSIYHFYQGLLAVLMIAAIFLIFSIYYQRTNRLWAVVIAHIIVDVTAMLDSARR